MNSTPIGGRYIGPSAVQAWSTARDEWVTMTYHPTVVEARQQATRYTGCRVRIVPAGNAA